LEGFFFEDNPDDKLSHPQKVADTVALPIFMND
jgi:hypothetical protein